MKKFHAKKIKILDEHGVELTHNPTTGKEIKFSFANMAVSALNSTVDGMSTNDMRMRFKIIDKMEAVEPDGTVNLEDAEMDALKHIVISMDDKKQWARLDRDLVEFVDYIRKIK
jgi:hypothetical protein